MAREELFVDRLGRVVLAFFETAGALAVFAGRAVVEAFPPPYEFRESCAIYTSSVWARRRRGPEGNTGLAALGRSIRAGGKHW